MKQLEIIFTNRELALLLWVFIGIVSILLIKPIRGPAINFLKSSFQILFTGNFLIIFQLLTIYLLLIVLTLNKLVGWNILYLKEVIFWLFTVGLALIFKSIQAKDTGFFTQVFWQGLKWTIIIEFIADLYSLSLIFEFVIFGVLTFIGLLQAVSELDKKNAQVSKILSNIFNISVISLFLYSLVKTIIQFDELFTITNLIRLLIPTTITILFIPFIYMLALYSAYESFFVRLNNMSFQTDKIKEVKKSVKQIANFNLNKLKRIMANFDRKVLFENIEIQQYIIQISKRKYLNIIFNDKNDIKD